MTLEDNSSFLSQVKGFTPVIDVLAKELGMMTALVYGIIWRYCQMDDRVCHASKETIGDHADISVKTVQRHVSKLVGAGYIIDLTPDKKHAPHTYKDAGRVQIRGLVEARLVGETERPTSERGRSESPTRSDRESYPGRTESPVKRVFEESLEENEDKHQIDTHSLTDLPSTEAQLDILFPSGGSGKIHDYERSMATAGWEIRRTDIRRAAALFLQASGLPIPNDKKTRASWKGVLGQHVNDFGVKVLKIIYPMAVDELRRGEFPVNWPGSLTKTLPRMCQAVKERDIKPQEELSIDDFEVPAFMKG